MSRGNVEVPRGKLGDVSIVSISGRDILYIKVISLVFPRASLGSLIKGNYCGNT